MEGKKDFGEKLEAFFAGKGFYIVLLLSAAVIGVSIWLMFFGSGTDVEDSTGMEGSSMEQASAQQTGGLIEAMKETTPTATPQPTSAPTPQPEAPAVNPEAGLNVPGETEETGLTESMEETLEFLWPVSGAVERGYSMEALLYDRTMADWRTHNGYDIAAELGTKVSAVADGTVSNVYTDDLYGTVVEIDHPNGLRSVYANLAAVPTVVIGQQVSAGETIGAVGDTALGEIGEACHLHFAMEEAGSSIDPALWLPMG